jgi:hypothetical protein
MFDHAPEAVCGEIDLGCCCFAAIIELFALSY